MLSLSESEQKVAELFGATESFLSRRATGQQGKKVNNIINSTVLESNNSFEVPPLALERKEETD